MVQREVSSAKAKEGQMQPKSNYMYQKFESEIFRFPQTCFLSDRGASQARLGARKCVLNTANQVPQGMAQIPRDSCGGCLGGVPAWPTAGLI